MISEMKRENAKIVRVAIIKVETLSARRAFGEFKKLYICNMREDGDEERSAGNCIDGRIFHTCWMKLNFSINAQSTFHLLYYLLSFFVRFFSTK